MIRRTLMNSEGNETIFSNVKNHKYVLICYVIPYAFVYNYTYILEYVPLLLTQKLFYALDNARAPRNISNIVINIWIIQIFNILTRYCIRISSFATKTVKWMNDSCKANEIIATKKPWKISLFSIHFFFLCRLYVQLHAYNWFKFTISSSQNEAFKNSTLHFQCAKVTGVFNVPTYLQQKYLMERHR